MRLNPILVKMTPLYLPADLGMVINNHCRNRKAIRIQCLLADKKFGLVVEDIRDQLEPLVIRQAATNKSKEFVHRTFVVQDPDRDAKSREFHSIQYKDSLYLLTAEDAGFFNHVMSKIVKKSYPALLPAFIHSDELLEILHRFQDVLRMELKSKKAVKKQIFGLMPSTEVKWEVGKANREYPSFEETFEEARSGDLWVDKITVFGTDGGRTKIQFSLSRHGLVTIKQGTFDTFFANVLHPITENAGNKRSKFQNRDRRLQPDKMPKPLIVRFGRNVFEKKETREEFSQIMNKYPHCSYSVIHSGNPHVYLSVLDRNDNSSFSVRTYGEDSLLLIPQIKTSDLALMRFSEFLATSFYDGVIQNFDQK